MKAYTPVTTTTIKLEHFHHPKMFPHVLCTQCPYPPNYWPQASFGLLSVTVITTFSRISQKQNHALCITLSLVYFSEHDILRYIYFVAYVFESFLFIGI